MLDYMEIDYINSFPRAGSLDNFIYKDDASFSMKNFLNNRSIKLDFLGFSKNEKVNLTKYMNSFNNFDICYGDFTRSSNVIKGYEDTPIKINNPLFDNESKQTIIGFDNEPIIVDKDYNFPYSYENYCLNVDFKYDNVFTSVSLKNALNYGGNLGGIAETGTGKKGVYAGFGFVIPNIDDFSDIRLILKKPKIEDYLPSNFFSLLENRGIYELYNSYNGYASSHTVNFTNFIWDYGDRNSDTYKGVASTLSMAYLYLGENNSYFQRLKLYYEDSFSYLRTKNLINFLRNYGFNGSQIRLYKGLKYNEVVLTSYEGKEYYIYQDIKDCYIIDFKEIYNYSTFVHKNNFSKLLKKIGFEEYNSSEIKVESFNLSFPNFPASLHKYKNKVNYFPNLLYCLNEKLPLCKQFEQLDENGNIKLNNNGSPVMVYDMESYNLGLCGVPNTYKLNNSTFFLFFENEKIISKVKYYDGEDKEENELDNIESITIEESEFYKVYFCFKGDNLEDKKQRYYNALGSVNSLEEKEDLEDFYESSNKKECCLIECLKKD